MQFTSSHNDSVGDGIDLGIAEMHGFIKMEDIDMTCWFCKVRDAAEKHDLPFEMFGDIDTRSTASETKVAYNVRHVEVPRCADCHSRHRDSVLSMIAAGVFLLSLITAVIFALYVVSAEWIWAVWLGLSAGLLIGALAVNLALLRGTLSTYKARKNYPEVKELRDNGYKFGRRPKDSLKSGDDEAGEER